jgi:hypothetical protein
MPTEQPPDSSASTSSPDESSWYRYLVGTHGRDGVSVGPVPPLDSYWVATRSEAEATDEEYADFCAGLEVVLKAFRERHRPGQRAAFPSLCGDFYVERTETFSNLSALRGRNDLVVELFELTQQYLAERAPLWRVVYGADEDSAIIYPDCIFLGPQRLDRASGNEPLIGAWFERVP